jgi:hypothetical protein
MIPVHGTFQQKYEKSSTCKTEQGPDFVPAMMLEHYKSKPKFRFYLWLLEITQTANFSVTSSKTVDNALLLPSHHTTV